VDIFRLNDVNGVLNTRLNVFDCQVRVIVSNDCIERSSLAHQFKDTLNRDA
jgi:hypothetical protein